MGMNDADHSNAETGDDELNPRTCIVTRETGDAETLIRFVCAPDGEVVPDLRRKLPGRGAWVGARRDLVEKAIRGSLFARAFKSKVSVSADLGQMVDDLLVRDALSALSLARKAGQVVTGFSKCDSAVRSNRAILVLHASEAAEDGIRKLSQAIHATEEMEGGPFMASKVFAGPQMDLALGADNVIHATALDGGGARNLVRRIAILERYRGKED